MAEAFFVLGANEQFGPLEHLLDHHARSILYLHHPVELQGEMLWGADVQRDAAHITLVYGTYDLCHYGESHLPGKGCQFVL